MTEKIKGFAIELDLDHLSVDRGLKGLKDNLRSVNAEMKANMSAFDYSEKSTRKYDTSLIGLNKKLEVQKKVVEAAKAEYEKMVAEHGRGSMQAEKAAREYNNQSASLANLERYIQKTTKEMMEFEKQQRIANSNWTKVGDALQSTGGKLTEVGRITKATGDKLTKNISVPLGVIGGIATKVGSDFEAGMSKVGAVSGASAEDMVELEKKAREMGATTVFSAKEASDAFYYMSLAGWDAQQSMDGIAGVMDLAAASGEDLASIADIVTDGLTAFGLKARDSGRMADVLASASSNANTDVRGLGQAFQYVAPVAGALGYSIEDTSKAIGLMANAGIKSTKAGTALRTMITNLTSDSDKAKKNMKKYGISLTDSAENMKSLDDVMLDMRKNLGKLDKEQQAQAATTLFGKEAMSGALAIINASEEDYKKLTKAIKESDGSAKDMAETMQDNLQGSIKGLQSMMEDLFIEMYKNLNPTLEAGVEKAKDLTKWFAGLSPETQALIVKFGLLAFAGGPVISMTGRMTEGLGKTFTAVGDVSKAIGKAGGLAAALTSLGPGAIAGIAVAGIGAVAYGLHHFKQKAEEAKEVNLELAESFTDQASELEANTKVFEELSEKANVSNRELAQLNDLNIRISESKSSEEIDRLQKSYDNLAERSGLSKDELNALYEANKKIIELSPTVEQSISKEGNAFVKNTEAVNKYIATLYEMSKQELELERVKHLEKEAKLREELTVEQRKLNDLQEQTNALINAQSMSTDEIYERQEEISALYHDNTISQEEKNKLQSEFSFLQAALNDELGEELEKHQESLKAQREKVLKKEEEIAKGEIFNTQYQDILLKQVGINEEGEKGLIQLEEKIQKNVEQLVELDNILAKEGELSEEQKKQYENLTNQNIELTETKKTIFDKTGLYKDLNTLANDHLEGLSKEEKQRVENLRKQIKIFGTEKDIVAKLDEKNAKLEIERNNLEENRKKQGANKAEIDYQIKSIDSKIAKNAEIKRQILEELGIWDKVDDSIRDGINSEIEKGRQIDNTKGKLGFVGSIIDQNNQKTDTGIWKEKERTLEAGKSVIKEIMADDKGTLLNIDKMAMDPKNKTINMLESGLSAITKEASKPVTKKINFLAVGLDKLKFWAKGTPPSGHPGGPAVVGDGGGSELIKLPSGRAFLSPPTDTLLNLPRGTHVIPHRATERLMKSFPKYAQGTENWDSLLMGSEFARLLTLNNNNSTVILQGSNQNNPDLGELINLIKDFILSAERTKEINQTNHFYSTAPLSPAETARKNKQMLRQFRLE